MLRSNSIHSRVDRMDFYLKYPAVVWMTETEFAFIPDDGLAGTK